MGSTWSVSETIVWTLGGLDTGLLVACVLTLPAGWLLRPEMRPPCAMPVITWLLFTLGGLPVTSPDLTAPAAWLLTSLFRDLGEERGGAVIQGGAHSQLLYLLLDPARERTLFSTHFRVEVVEERRFH